MSSPVVVNCRGRIWFAFSVPEFSDELPKEWCEMALQSIREATYHKGGRGGYWRMQAPIEAWAVLYQHFSKAVFSNNRDYSDEMRAAGRRGKSGGPRTADWIRDQLRRIAQRMKEEGVYAEWVYARRAIIGRPPREGKWWKGLKNARP